jgi:hypothetical protein
MARDWVVRTDWRRLDEVIMPALNEGLLRQGWGYQDDQDLNVIGALVYSEGRHALNEDQKATWRRVQRFWPEHWDPVQTGDRVLLPKVPFWGRWRLVEVVGDYRFERHPRSGDHGHILPVKTLVADIASSNTAVGAPLQRTMRNQGPMWNIDGLSKYVDRLVAAGSDAARGDGPTDRLKNILNEARNALLPQLRDSFQANQLEEPVLRLLTHMFPEADVQKHAGPSERGADFLIVESNAFDHERRTVVQLKDYAEVLSGARPLQQIREAFSAHAPVAAAVIVTTALEEQSQFSRARDDLSEELGIPVTTVLGPQLASWFFANLEAIAAD